MQDDRPVEQDSGSGATGARPTPAGRMKSLPFAIICLASANALLLYSVERVPGALLFLAGMAVVTAAFLFLPVFYPENVPVISITSLFSIVLEITWLLILVIYLNIRMSHLEVALAGIAMLLLVRSLVPSILPGTAVTGRVSSPTFFVNACIAVFFLTLASYNGETTTAAAACIFTLATIFSAGTWYRIIRFLVLAVFLVAKTLFIFVVAVLWFFKPPLVVTNIILSLLLLLITLGSVVVMVFFSFPVLLVQLVFLAAAVFVDRFLPGRSITTSLKETKKTPIALNPRLYIVPAVDVLLVIIFFAIPCFVLPGIKAAPAKELKPVPLLESPAGEKEAYEILLGPRGDFLYASFCHSGEPGFGRIDLEQGASHSLRFRHLDVESGACHPTLVTDRNLAVLHATVDASGGTAQAAGPAGAAIVFNLEDFSHRTILTRELQRPVRSLYNSRTDELIILDMHKSRLWFFPFDNFIDRNLEDFRVRDAGSVPAIEGMLANPDLGTIYLYGQTGPYFVELDPETRRTRRLFKPKTIWDIALSPDGDLLYLSRPLNFRIDMVDTKNFTAAGSISTFGMPRAVEPLYGNLVAAGLYMGKAVLVYDTRTGEPVCRVPACSRVRSMDYDPRRNVLYYNDQCGIFSVALDECEPG